MEGYKDKYQKRITRSTTKILITTYSLSHLVTKSLNKKEPMKKLIATSLILITGALSVNAQMLSSSDVKASVAKILETNYRKMTNGDVEVKVSATPFSELQLPDGKVSYKITSGADKVVPRDIKRVDVYVNNAFVKSLNLPVQTVIYKDVLVANDFINRDQALTNETVSVKKMDVSMKMDYVLGERALSKEMSAKKAFQKGEVIDKRFVKMRPDVQRNGEVRVFFVSNGAVMVSVDGTAMSDGMYGDYIDVENKNYKKVYNGKVIGENKVLVNI